MIFLCSSLYRREATFSTFSLSTQKLRRLDRAGTSLLISTALYPAHSVGQSPSLVRQLLIRYTCRLWYVSVCSCAHVDSGTTVFVPVRMSTWGTSSFVPLRLSTSITSAFVSACPSTSAQGLFLYTCRPLVHQCLFLCACRPLNHQRLLFNACRPLVHQCLFPCACRPLKHQRLLLYAC